MANRYNSSSLPVREALRALGGEGFVDFEPNKGAQVRTIDADFISELMEVRASIEANLARRAALRVRPQDVLELREIQADYERAITATNYQRALDINYQFHNKINELSGSSEAAFIVARNWRLLATLWKNYGRDAHRFAGVISDHRQLIDALSLHDSTAAEHIMSGHVHKSKLSMLKVISGK